MPLTDDQLVVVRSWVGEVVDDQTLHDRYDRLQTLDATVEEELRSQLAVAIDQPTQVSLPSGLSISKQQNLMSAEKRLKDFLSFGSLDDDVFEAGPVTSSWARSYGR